MNTEPVWEHWFSSAEGLIPRSALPDNSSLPPQMKEVCAFEPNENVIDKQHLFSVYVHNSEEEPDDAGENLFSQKLTPLRIKTEYGEHSIMDATRILIREALETHANKKFVILSESGIPLYPAAMIYAQLISEQKSRVNACTDQGVQTWKWNGFLERLSHHGISSQQLRNSMHRMALRRDHAAIVASDIDYNRIFRKLCSFKVNACSTDEFYIPTLLSLLQKENETDCQGVVAKEYFNTGTSHPQTFLSEDINKDIIPRLREPVTQGVICTFPTLREVMTFFIQIDDAVDPLKSTDGKWNISLGSGCPLFARKFDTSTSEKLMNIISDCNNGLQFVKDCLETRCWWKWC